MDLGLAGRKAIVCASSRGLGKACARALAEAGCEVVINGRDGKTLEATAAELSKLTGAKIIAVVADLASPDGQQALFAYRAFAFPVPAGAKVMVVRGRTETPVACACGVLQTTPFTAYRMG